MSVVGKWAREMASQLTESRKHGIYLSKLGRNKSTKSGRKG